MEQYWNREKDTCPDQQCFERAATKEEQNKTKQRIIVQNVAIPQQHKMRNSNQQQDE